MSWYWSRRNNRIVGTEKDSAMVRDHTKVKRAPTEVIGMVTESKYDELKKNGLDNLLFDGRT